jgi:hypothetical protein
MNIEFFYAGLKLIISFYACGIDEINPARWKAFNNAIRGRIALFYPQVLPRESTDSYTI